MSEGLYWAEPDLRETVQQLRYLVKNPGDRTRRARAGSEFVRLLYSDERLVNPIKRRLDEIRAALRFGQPDRDAARPGAR